MKNIGRFITIEGADCCGKTTLIGGLKSVYPDFLYIKEPGSTPIGKEIKNLISDHLDDLNDESKLLLFFASFLQTSEDIIRPNLNIENTIICERWYYSAHCYQIYVQGMSMYEDITDVIEQCFDIIYPSLNIVIDVSPALVIDRLEEKYERTLTEEECNYYEKVCEYYSTICKGVLVDGTLSEEDLRDQVIEVINGN
jgi:dTMP kinase